MGHILVLYYSRHGATKKMAEYISLGIEMAGGLEARRRRVAPLDVPEACQTSEAIKAPVDDLVVEPNDLRTCAGLAIGSPTRFGNMGAPLKHFLDGTSDLWISRELADKPACAFTASSTASGGQGTLISMILPLLHHGMIYIGSSGQPESCPYGSLHVSGALGGNEVSDVERSSCIAQGYRLATLALKLQTVEASSYSQG